MESRAERAEMRDKEFMAKRANGEGSIYRRRDGLWIAQVDIGWATGGKRKRKYVAAKTRAEAARQLRSLLADRDAGRVLTTKSPTVKDWFDVYINQVASKRVRPQTLARYRADVDNHIVPEIGRRRLNQLRAVHLSELYSAKLQAGLSARSVRHLHAVIRHALNVAIRWELININPATRVDLPAVPHREIQPLDAKEARRLLDAAKGDRLECRWGVGLALGLRQGEALGLWWQDVDLDRGALTVRRALQRQRATGGGQLVFTEPKTSRSRRTISLPPPLVDLLRAHKTRQLEERLQAGSMWRGSECVFTTVLGGPIEPKADWEAFKALLKAAGLRDVRLHDLRHTAASLLLVQGVSPRVVMEILGHSQISLTLNTYTHVAPELQEHAMGQMAAALWG